MRLSPYVCRHRWASVLDSPGGAVPRLLKAWSFESRLIFARPALSTTAPTRSSSAARIARQIYAPDVANPMRTDVPRIISIVIRSGLPSAPNVIVAG